MTRREWMTLWTATACFAADPIDVFFEELLTEWMKTDPESSTMARFFRGAEQDAMDARLTELSDAAAHARIARAKAALARLRKFDAKTLSAGQKISAEMLDFQLQLIVDEEPFLAYNFPINQFFGVQNRLTSLLTDMHPVRNARDVENYLARLEGVGPKLNGALAMMQDRAKQGVRLPGFIAVETLGQMKRFTAPAPGQNILVTSLEARMKALSTIPPEKQAAYVASAEKLVRDGVYPAYGRALDGLATINARGTEAAGLWRLPKGDAAYAFHLRRMTTLPLSAAAIHETGKREVARIEAEMEERFRALGYTTGTITERYKKLEADNLYPAGPDVRERILADYTAMIAANHERSLGSFLRVPKSKCIVQRIPSFQEANAAANYSAPPRDGSRPGIFRVPLRGPEFSRVGMKTLTAHEAIPGHHFQLALQVEMESLPGFRRQNPFGQMSAYAEGWGLYAEQLAYELGWYKDDKVGDLGRLNGELFRARRLVTDTGLHAYKWTREQAIAYGIPQSEVDRYVVMPGQACSYKIGMLKILELREEARKKMGAKFVLPAFHDVVLRNGAVPLVQLEKIVREWAG